MIIIETGLRKRESAVNYDEFELNIPQDTESPFEPQRVKKRKKDRTERNSKSSASTRRE